MQYILREPQKNVFWTAMYSVQIFDTGEAFYDSCHVNKSIF